MSADPIRYLALGDSYTIGTGLETPSKNYPSLLARRLTEEIGVPVEILNLGVNGYTTADLIREELPVARRSKPDIVTLLIGANDIVQGVSDATYRDRLAEIYGTILPLPVRAQGVLVISIPDFSALAGAASFGAPEQLRARIDAFNQVARSGAERYEFGFVDIATVSRAKHVGADWLAPDELHPGPDQHRAFAEQIWEVGERRWKAALIWSRIEHLPPEQRTAMTLKFAEDRKIEEIAATMGKSTGAVELLLHRAVEQLRKDA